MPIASDPVPFLRQALCQVLYEDDLTAFSPGLVGRGCYAHFADEKLRFREGKGLAQGHTARRQWSRTRSQKRSCRAHVPGLGDLAGVGVGKK